MRALSGLLLTLLAGLALSACGGSTEGASSPTDESTTATQPANPSREQAPAIEDETLDGTPIALADFRGRPVLVNVWSSW